MDISLYLLKNYSNYFNKKVRRKTSLNAYLGAVEDSFELESTDFNPNDGVATTHVVGSASSPYEPTWNPDYVIVVDKDDNNKIISRWFVTEFRRNMINQYTISLRRDVISDFYESCINSPCYIEKAHLDDDDPFIVNNEGMSFNQIKKKEYYIKDETKVPWVVVYLNQHNRETKEIKSKFSSPNIIEIEDAPELRSLFPNIMSATTDQKVNHKIFNDADFSFVFKYYFSEHAIPIIYGRVGEVGCYFSVASSVAKLLNVWDRLGWHDRFTIFNGSGGAGYTDNGWDSMPGGRILKDVMADACANFKNDFNNKVQSLFNEMGCTHHSNDYRYPSVDKYIGKIIHVGATGKYFVFDIKKNASEPYDKENSSIKTSICDSFNAVSHNGWSLQHDGQVVQVHASISSDIVYQMSLNTASDVKMNLIGTRKGETPDGGYETQLEPYDIVCFPAFTTKMTKLDGNKIETIGLAGINIARAMSEQLGTDVLYDVQILPYCPCRELIGEDGDIDLRLANTNQAMPIKDNADNIVSYGLVATSPYNNFEIQTLGTSIYDNNEVPCSSELVVDDKKEVSNCDMFRLSSPNYASSFEFNLAKCVPINKPEITKFKIDICYRPYNPYIHIAPEFAFLYGGDFNDSRGLICSGDFGLTTMKNAWTDYQVRNKNYQNMFDRQISHMETDFSISQKKQDFNFLIGAIASALNSSVATIGAGAGGAISQNPMGYIAAGGIATRNAINQGAGLASWLTNRGLNREQLNENISYSRDMFNMQLDNIKALPNSITHSASLTNNFKFYPVLEYYSCTIEEKIAFKNKLRYNGMTVGRIDIIKNYISDSEERFIKGQMIRIESIGEDSHIAMEIYNVINSGVFFTPEGE